MAKSREGVFEVVDQVTREGGTLPLLPLLLLLPHLFCLHALLLIHRRAGAFGIVKQDFCQGSLWEES